MYQKHFSVTTKAKTRSAAPYNRDTIVNPLVTFKLQTINVHLDLKCYFQSQVLTYGKIIPALKKNHKYY